MNLYVFSTAVLSIIFMVVFSSWWVSGAAFSMHLSALIIAVVTALSIMLMIAVYPVLNKRYAVSRPASRLNRTNWAYDVSSNLSTPAAVVDGYTVIFANKAFLTDLGMLGMSEQLVGMPITNMVHPSDHAHLAQLFAMSVHEHTARQDRESRRLRMLCMDGSIMPVHIALSPLHDDSHTHLNLLQFSSENSSEAQEFDYVDQSNYQQLINRIEQIVFHINVKQQILFLNAAWERLLDFKVADSLNQPLLSFVHPEDKPLAEARINSLIQGKRNKALVEFRLIGRNGDSHWLEMRAQNTTSYKGERSSVIGTLTDISDSKMAEASLRTNRHQLNTLISNIPGMIYRCKSDAHWSFEFVSDGCFDVTGYEPYEMINSPNFSFMQIIHPDDRAMTREVVQRNVGQEQKFQLMYRIITRSGATKWVWEQGKGIFSSAGELLALEGFITDISNQSSNEFIAGFQKLLLDDFKPPTAV